MPNTFLSTNKGNISKDQNSKMSVCLNHYEYINNCISQLDTAISLLSREFKSHIKIISSVPGLTEKSATTVVSEIGTNMLVFKDAKHLCSWAGVVPQNNESAGYSLYKLLCIIFGLDVRKFLMKKQTFIIIPLFLPPKYFNK